MNQRFYSKLLLFGEYTLMSGSSALAIPFDKYYGEWIIGDYDLRLAQLAVYLTSLNQSLNLNLDKFSTDIGNGLRFQSNIPQGFGLGSSGALCGGLYSRYGTDTTEDLQELKHTFGLIESFYHGTSSGLDPLVSFLGEGLVFNSSKELKRVGRNLTLGNNISSFFLLNSNKSRESEKLINTYKGLIKSNQFKSDLKTTIIPLVDDCINYTLTENWNSLLVSFAELSQWQNDNLQEMILPEIKDLWQQGLHDKKYFLKLCGAGGGGFYLGFGDINTIKELDNVILL